MRIRSFILFFTALSTLAHADDEETFTTIQGGLACMSDLMSEQCAKFLRKYGSTACSELVSVCQGQDMDSCQQSHQSQFDACTDSLSGGSFNQRGGPGGNSNNPPPNTPNTPGSNNGPPSGANGRPGPPSNPPNRGGSSQFSEGMPCPPPMQANLRGPPQRRLQQLSGNPLQGGLFNDFTRSRSQNGQSRSNNNGNGGGSGDGFLSRFGPPQGQGQGQGYGPPGQGQGQGQGQGYGPPGQGQGQGYGPPGQGQGQGQGYGPPGQGQGQGQGQGYGPPGQGQGQGQGYGPPGQGQGPPNRPPGMMNGQENSNWSDDCDPGQYPMDQGVMFIALIAGVCACCACIFTYQFARWMFQSKAKQYKYGRLATDEADAEDDLPTFTFLPEDDSSSDKPVKARKSAVTSGEEGLQSLAQEATATAEVQAAGTSD